MKAGLLKVILKTSLPIVLEVLSGINVRGWRVSVTRDNQNKIMSVCVTRES